jgi:hypothetical protein
MPSNAIAAGVVDRVLAVEDMPEVLLTHALDLAERPAGMPGLPDEQLTARIPAICQILQRTTGHDFSRYKKKHLGPAHPAPHRAGAPLHSGRVLRAPHQGSRRAHGAGER